MTVQQFREKVNLKIYRSKNFALNSMRFLLVIVSLITLASLIYYHGYPQTEESRKILIFIVEVSFAVYIFNYLLRIFYSFEPLKLIREKWFEGILMALLAFEGISYNFFDTLVVSEIFIRLGIKNITHYYAVFIQIYFLAAVFSQVIRSTQNFTLFKINPSNIFIFTFILIIISGTGLLMLPEMTTVKGSMRFIDALFTSTSATCVTGLIVVDTPAYFTFKGQFIIMMLIKLGGLNIIAFGSFIALASKFGMGVKQHETLEDFLSRDSILSSKGILGKVIIWSVVLETIGATLLFFTWDEAVPFKDVWNKIFLSVFHSLAAFNNAGFSLFTNGMHHEALRNSWLTHGVLTLIIFFGSLGFVAIFELLDFNRIKLRMKYPWKQLSFASKIALYFSIGLILFGAIAFYVLEKDNTLSGKPVIGIIITSVFQSIVTRTAGFNSVDIAQLGLPIMIVIMFLMFIGASSSSTGGGIKTSTFALLWATTIATIRGRKTPELFQKSISNEMSFKAFSVFLFYVACNLICIFLLTITEDKILATPGRSLIDIIFEQVSAFSTVGLSTGITSMLSDYGRVILIFSMFIGRVGALTVAFALVGKAVSTNYKYPTGHTMVG